jgi:hypothetical protein
MAAAVKVLVVVAVLAVAAPRSMPYSVNSGRAVDVFI